MEHGVGVSLAKCAGTQRSEYTTGAPHKLPFQAQILRDIWHHEVLKSAVDKGWGGALMSP